MSSLRSRLTVLMAAVVVAVTTLDVAAPVAAVVANAEQSRGVGLSLASTDPMAAATRDSDASAAAARRPLFRAALEDTGTTSNVLIPAALFGAGVLLFAFAVRRAKIAADAPSNRRDPISEQRLGVLDGHREHRPTVRLRHQDVSCASPRWPDEVELHSVDEGVVVDRAGVCGTPTEALEVRLSGLSEVVARDR